MKTTSFVQLVGKLHQAVKIHNLHQVCGVFGCVSQNYGNTVGRLQFADLALVINIYFQRFQWPICPGRQVGYPYTIRPKQVKQHFFTCNFCPSSSLHCQHSLKLGYYPIRVAILGLNTQLPIQYIIGIHFGFE